MHDDYSKNEIDYIRRYEAAGFTDQYRIIEDELENVDSKKRYAPQDVTILKEHRYEGISNPSDMSLLYVIQTNDGSKGTMLASYGSDGNNSIHEFMNAIPESNVKDDFMLPPDAKDHK
ncbi:hypothetical protein BXY82_3033 [Gelidibacter sediminis]|uniref:Phosphoribosylpyrophosphate synthetase n=1 Tax=Gelidibacter sediminis TaxID=1608710 RepID=A0A4V3F6R9_9FLAO|nr:hypothetical protein [Gelidibacter sediminis]TDU33736.1 hypothetical protein BXY82_3033 [Gelidibacter sediminis]